ncbi:hypothetical protein SAMN05444955_12810 [Lihuaxuella thermophila]|uniref:Uncharacterized protein n=1 Tax=Lihuaxuella thermophila TaxID=1173111 RepID=A0A1H8JLZ2_9BACL|nr:hypothetical protein SAMN05444955_12810 [Lihuaxuella thermophila]
MLIILIILLIFLILSPLFEWFLDPFIREAIGLGEAPYQKVEDYTVSKS